MASRPPNDPDYPKSPDQLERGLRGPIGGVTRIGPRAFGLAFFVICALLVAILYGLNRGPSFRGSQEAYASPPPPQPTNLEHFGQNEPIVATAPPATAPPPLVLPPTSVPNLDQQQQENNKPAAAPAPAAPQAPSQEEMLAAQRRADEARARDEEEKKRRELAESALKSPILANGTTGGGAGGQVQLAYAGNGGGVEGQETGYVPANGSAATGGTSGGSGFAPSGASPANALLGRSVPAAAETHAPQSTAYLEGPSGQYAVQAANVVLPRGGDPKDFLQAQRFAPVSQFEIVASSVIPASLVTGIDSELPGLVTAEVREDIYDSKTGRFLLIPKGAKLVGLYNSQIQYGQTRALVAWQRLIFPDTTSIDLLNMSGADVQGGAGLAGTVDNHYGKIFGAALLTSILAAGAELAAPQQSSILTNPSAGQVVSQSVGQQIAQTGTQIVQKDLNIPPTLHIPRGYPFLVIVDRDIVLPGVYHGQ